MTGSLCRRRVARLSTAIGIAAAIAAPLQAQVVGFTQQRPFVIGVVPVVANGAVGGIEVDAAGLVARAEPAAIARHRAAQETWAAVAGAPQRGAPEGRLPAERPGVAAPLGDTALRKISLRRLEAALAAHLKSAPAGPLPVEMELLAGLQRVRYVVADREDRDIVLVGPADTWRVAATGHVVGRTSGRPLLRLADLVALLQAAADGAGEPLRCSIDPRPEGVAAVRQLTEGRRLRSGRQALAALRKALGPHQVTVGGVPADSRPARTMVAADYLMKRLAMRIEAPPVDGLPSYLDLRRESRGAGRQAALPRWWLAPADEPPRRDAAGMTWQLSDGGVRAMTETRQLDMEGRFGAAGPEDPAARAWATRFTARYADLARREPAFAELAGMIDLALVAAIVIGEDLEGRAGCDLPLLLDSQQLSAGRYEVPRTVASEAGLVAAGDSWLVGLAGGVEIDAWELVRRAEKDDKLAEIRAATAARRGDGWWWEGE